MGGRQEGRRGRRLRIGFLEGVGRNRLDDRAGLRCDSEQRRDANGAGRFKVTAERNPLGLALAGAAVGFVAGLLAPSTRFEDEKVGPISDQVKSQAADVGEEALEHGKQVAQAVADSAVETAKQEGKEHGEELSSSVHDKAQEAHRARADPSRRRLGAPSKASRAARGRNGK